MNISVVIPVYNEANTIEAIVKRVQAVKLHKEIIIVDDGSTDETREKLERLAQKQKDIKIVTHDKNRGKGAALRTGFGSVNGDVVIIQDADLEYNPKDYAKLLEPILDERADVVYGSRFLGGPHRVLFFWHFVANKFLTLLSNAVNNINLSDMETGYKVFRKDVIENMVLRSNRFGFEPEFTAKICKKKCRIYEVPISYSGRTYIEGKKINWKDGLRALFIIFWARLFD
ncbi:glycosyltransferase family 2 protein [bacterium]|nr:glycosyltransferase family 2 protein [bacterium]